MEPEDIVLPKDKQVTPIVDYSNEKDLFVNLKTDTLFNEIVHGKEVSHPVPICRFHLNPFPHHDKYHSLPVHATMSLETIAQAIASVETVTTPGGPALAGFEIRQLPDTLSFEPFSSTTSARQDDVDLKMLLVSHAKCFRITDFKELLSAIPVKEQAEVLRGVLLALIDKKEREAFQFVLKNVSNPAEIAEDILSTGIGQVYCDQTIEVQSSHPSSIEERFIARIKREEEYQFVIKCIYAAYPDVENYIRHITPKIDNIMRGFLSPEGIRLIVDELKSQGEFNNINCIICDSIKDGAEKIRNFVKQENQAAKGCCFIVRTRDEFHPESLHVQPIYIERQGDGFDCIILDSTGAKGGESTSASDRYPYSHSFKIPDYLGNENLLVKFFHYNVRRQIDGSNCPIFSIRDVLAITRDPDAIMSLVRKTAKVVKRFPLDENNFIFDLLPPNLMLPTQSSTTLTNYFTEYRTRSGKDDAKLTHSKITQHTVKRVVLIKGQDSKQTPGELSQNVYVERKYRKYERRIIAIVIKKIIAGK